MRRSAPACSEGLDDVERERAQFPPTAEADDLPSPSTPAHSTYTSSVPTTSDGAHTYETIWPPSTVIKEDRGKAIFTWVLLLAAFLLYVGYLYLDSLEARKSPPVQILHKEEPFELPDVIVCPSTGDGCNASDGSDCPVKGWYLSAVEGLSDCEKFFATPSPAAPTQSPSSPTWAGTPPPSAASAQTNTPTSPVVYYSSAVGTLPPAPEAVSRSPVATTSPTSSPVVLPAIRVNVETTAYDWCPRVLLSNCAIDYDGIESGEVRSLHASFYVLWDDKASSDFLPSTRQFINTFFVDNDVEATDAVVDVRLPYDRVNITGTEPFTFLSNDVILSMSQYVPLDKSGNKEPPERSFTQATTTAQHTIRLDNFDGEEYEGALLYVTLSVNNFAYQSIEEVDPVDWWALVGSTGGVWEIICVAFGVFFVAAQVAGPDKRWGWAKTGGSCNRGA